MKVKTLKSPKRNKRKIGYLPPSLSWLPDWKNKEEYNYLMSASSKQWAWEFLRRNFHYRALREALEENGDLETLELAQQLKLVRKNDGFLEIINSMSHLEKFHNALFNFHSSFGILNFPPPSSESFPDVNFEVIAVIGTEGIGKNRDVSLSLSKNQIVCILNLDMPLQSFNSLRKTFKAMKKERQLTSFRRREDFQYILYLRVLDAHARGYGNDAIAEVLYPNMDNTALTNFSARNHIQNYHSVAEKLMENDYKFLGAKQE